MAEVLEAMPFSPSGRQRQNGVVAIERLDGGFLINAENGRVLRWVHVEPNDVGGFLLKVRVIGQHVSFETMRLQSRSFPDPSHHHMADSKMLCEFARGPMRRTIGWALPRIFQDPSFQYGRPSLCTTTWMTGKQTRESVLIKALLPPAYVVSIATQGGCEPGVGVSIRESQRSAVLGERLQPAEFASEPASSAPLSREAPKRAVPDVIPHSSSI